MKVPAGWLRQYLSKPLSTEAMAEALEAGGIEVEQILHSKKLSEHIVVAKVKKVAQHPQADKLRIATIEAGGGKIELVCGAPNLETGQTVAYARVGAALPDGTTIKKASIRGIESPGMLCSPQELGLNQDHSGLLVLPENAKLGRPVADYLPNDDVIDLTTQANRFDLLSLIGLAREVAAQTDAELKEPPTSELPSRQSPLPVKIAAKEAVERYLLVGLKLNQSHGTAPGFQQQLAAAGSRSINLAVDITNYTMLETGQPLHAFDADKVKLPIEVRFARDSEELVTLDGTKRRLTQYDLVIADQTGPIALAGVMGGAATEVTAETTEILLESATFNGAVVRKMAQRHGLRTEASARFERQLVTKLAEVGLTRAIFNYQQAAAAAVSGGLFDSLAKLPEQLVIEADPDHIGKVVSLTVTAKDLARELPKFGFKVTVSGASVAVAVPWWRSDVKLAEDLAEEYIRLVGYDQVEARLPVWRPTQVLADRYWPNLWRLKAALKGQGLFEVVTYSFVAKEQLEHFGYDPNDYLKLKNPLSSEQAYLRRSLLPSLLTAAVRNQTYRPDFGLYEVSQVFIPTKAGQQPHEPRQLGVLIKRRQPSYAGAKAALDVVAAEFKLNLRLEPAELPGFLPGRAANILINGHQAGRIGEVHPKFLKDFKARSQVAYLELDIDQVFRAAEVPSYQAISRFPSLYRDLAVVVNRSVLWQDVERAIVETGLAKASFLNDYYEGMETGKKSLAMRLEMVELTATLTDKAADARLSQIEALLSKRFGAKLRR